MRREEQGGRERVMRQRKTARDDNTKTLTIDVRHCLSHNHHFEEMALWMVNL